MIKKVNGNLYPVCINKKKISLRQVRKIIRNLSVLSNLEFYGGALFKYRFHEEHDFSFVPSIVDGERGYHYNLKLNLEDSYIITGMISAAGELQLLIKPESLPINQEALLIYRKQYKCFAGFFVNNGYPQDSKLSEVTVALLKDAGIFSRDVKILRDLLE